MHSGIPIVFAIHTILAESKTTHETNKLTHQKSQEIVSDVEDQTKLQPQSILRIPKDQTTYIDLALIQDC